MYLGIILATNGERETGIKERINMKNKIYHLIKKLLNLWNRMCFVISSVPLGEHYRDFMSYEKFCK